MGIDCHFNLWNYFRMWFPQGSNTEVVVLVGVVLHVKPGHGVDPYIDLPMLESVNRWQKIWFFMRNDATAPLPMFMGNRPVPQPI
jgi:hypothetical protein